MILETHSSSQVQLVGTVSRRVRAMFQYALGLPQSEDALASAPPAVLTIVVSGRKRGASALVLIGP